MDRRRIALALGVYGALSAVALAWGAAQGRWDLHSHPDPWLRLDPGASALAGLGLGLAVALVVIASTRWLVRRTAWASRLHADFRDILGPLSTAEITIFAVSSGVAEELFFRGALQPAAGLLASSVIFGAVHIGPKRRFWVWTAWAGAMGVAFGALYQATGSLVAPVIAHVVINYENMHFIEAFDPSQASRPATAAPPRARRVSAPSLVGERIRAGGRAG